MLQLCNTCNTNTPTDSVSVLFVSYFQTCADIFWNLSGGDKLYVRTQTSLRTFTVTFLASPPGKCYRKMSEWGHLIIQQEKNLWKKFSERVDEKNTDFHHRIIVTSCLPPSLNPDATECSRNVPAGVNTCLCLTISCCIHHMWTAKTAKCLNTTFWSSYRKNVFCSFGIYQRHVRCQKKTK